MDTRKNENELTSWAASTDIKQGYAPESAGSIYQPSIKI